jgi:hypothetical protein
MRIVVFNSPMIYLSGGQVNARDWALGLKARGHKVTLFALVAGPLAEEVRQAGISVISDPALMADKPDVLFGYGQNDLVAMIARFPDVPAVQVTQQWGHWEHFPCPLPQVVHHVAVDDINAEMLVNEFGLAREQVRVVYNAVDLSRLPRRTRILPGRPERALVFVKAATPYLDAVRRACSKRNIVPEFIGYPVGRPHPNPLAEIVNSDIVIGTARTAIEGAVGGAAVLVADQRGMGGLLTMANLQHFRANNFGREILTMPLDEDAIGAEIDAYDAVDAASVSQFMRENASLDAQITQIEAILVDAVARFQVPDAGSFGKVLSTYLALHLPRGDEPSPRHERSLSGFDLAHRVPGLPERLAAAEKLAATVDERFAASERQSAGVEKGLAELGGQLASLGERLEVRSTGLDERLAGLEVRFTGLDDRLARLQAACDERLAAIEKRLAAADERDATLTQRLLNSEALLGSVEDRFRRNEPLIRLVRPLAKYARKLPWLGLAIACWMRDAALASTLVAGG